MGLRTWCMIVILMSVTLVSAQDVETGLETGAIDVSAGVGSFGQPVQMARGELINRTVEAYADVTLTASVYDADDALIGEGIGFLVDACGAGLPFDFALQPGASQPFDIPLELYESDAVIDRVEVSAAGTPVAPDAAPIALADGVRRITSGEAVAVEWIGAEAEALRFATGCRSDQFFEWSWWLYDPVTDASGPIDHPRAEAVTPALRTALRLEDDALFARSRLTFDPDGTRLIYQDGVNRFYTAAADGRFQRLLYTGLNSYTLQEVYWLAGDRLIAHYYGAFGDDVTWFTADAESRPISPAPLRNRPSVIRPGATADGRRVVLAGTYPVQGQGEVTGYFITVVTNGFFDLLLQAEPPGNNYPSPIPLTNADDLVDRVYLAREIDGLPVMQCFNRDEGVLYDQIPLPFRLTPGHQAQWWIAPDESAIALAADGVGGGLWWIDRAALPPCAAE